MVECEFNFLSVTVRHNKESKVEWLKCENEVCQEWRLYILHDFRDVDLVIEVAHPDLIRQYATVILDNCDLFVSLFLNQIGLKLTYKTSSPTETEFGIGNRFEELFEC